MKDKGEANKTYFEHATLETDKSLLDDVAPIADMGTIRARGVWHS